MLFAIPMRLRINTKITLGLSLLVLLSLLVMVTIYTAFMAVQRAFQVATKVEGISNDAAYEMEINVVETGLNILQYLEAEAPQYREKVTKDHMDFVHFLKQYRDVAEHESEVMFSDKVEKIYAKCHTLGTALMDAKDRQDAALR